MAALMLPESIIVLSYSNHQLLTTIKQKELEAKYRIRVNMQVCTCCMLEG